MCGLCCLCSFAVGLWLFVVVCGRLRLLSVLVTMNMSIILKKNILELQPNSIEQLKLNSTEDYSLESVSVQEHLCQNSGQKATQALDKILTTNQKIPVHVIKNISHDLVQAIL